MADMFWVSLDFNDETKLTGLDALDARRRLKLPDASNFTTEDDRSLVGAVDEAFARAHFKDRTARTITRIVPFDFFVAGDLEECADRVIRVRKDLEAARIIALWLASPAE